MSAPPSDCVRDYLGMPDQDEETLPGLRKKYRLVQLSESSNVDEVDEVNSAPTYLLYLKFPFKIGNMTIP